MTVETMALQPLVGWPRQVANGGRYLVTVDLRPGDLQADWPYPEEEYPVGLMLTGRTGLTVESLGQTSLVLHRFGGTYGPARFVVVVDDHILDGAETSLWLTLISSGGIPFHTTELPVTVNSDTPAPAVLHRVAGSRPSPLPGALRERYLRRLRERYRRVDLEVLLPAADSHPHPVIPLEWIFVPQHVRPDPPPAEVPREVWQRLVEAGPDGDAYLPGQLDRDQLEAMRRTYEERPRRPVLEVLAEPANRRVVLLGDPGAGKSTLVRYLMLALAGSGSAQTGADDSGEPVVGPVRLPAGLAGCLPLMVELRTYADPGRRAGRDASYLGMIDHRYTTEALGLPRSALEPYLDSGGAAVVFFDGLDEVFDPRLREQATAQIAEFAARYPQTRVVVTSRAIGYRPQLLDAAGFGHWTLQDLDDSQIRDFITLWCAQPFSDDPVQAARLRDRLLVAVNVSASVRELAANPMLLTILAIIGRRGELPRERRRVYEQAVTVLVEHWDVNRHLRDERITVDLLDHQDKLELLQLVARQMQDAPAGLAGNHVPGLDLIEWFRNHLEERFGLPAERSIPAARAMLAQFRERNFILARFGPEVYGFVHRAFLEYLAAADLHRRLINYEITTEQVLAVYDRHWQDPAWTEVLLLLAGMVPDRIATQAIIRLLDADPQWQVRDRLPRHLLLALQATTEIRKTAALAPHAPALTQALTSLLDEAAVRENRHDWTFAQAIEQLAPHLTQLFSRAWPAADLYQHWYQEARHRLTGRVRYTVARTAAAIHMNLIGQDLNALRAAADDTIWVTREAAVQAIAAGWASDPSTLPWLRDRATTDASGEVRQAAVQAIAAGWASDPSTLPWLRDRATTDDDGDVRQAAVTAIATGWADDPATLPWLRERATTDASGEVRQAAEAAIARSGA
ncbi:HEAT repeat domain-containing protein [Actinoplanes sp. NPDC049802]|uniref:NACHT domain-containing protein n=1 Tax=Actinoplanes sp. NPDC049802 TaxID=3154742 RepID=UPI0034092F28